MNRLMKLVLVASTAATLNGCACRRAWNRTFYRGAPCPAPATADPCGCGNATLTAPPAIGGPAFTPPPVTGPGYSAPVLSQPPVVTSPPLGSGSAFEAVPPAGGAISSPAAPGVNWVPMDTYPIPGPTTPIPIN